MKKDKLRNNLRERNNWTQGIFSTFFVLHTDINLRIKREANETISSLAFFFFWNIILVFSKSFSAEESYKELIYTYAWTFFNLFDLTHKTDDYSYYPLLLLYSFTCLVCFFIYSSCFIRISLGKKSDEKYLKLLSMIFSHHFWILFIPGMLLSLNVFSCNFSKLNIITKEKKCFCDSPLGWLLMTCSFIDLLITFYFGIISCVFTFQVSHKSRDFLRRMSYSYSSTLFFGTCYFLVYKFIFQKQEIRFLLRNINYGVVFTFELYSLYLLIFKLPFFDRRVNKLLMMKSFFWIYSCCTNGLIEIFKAAEFQIEFSSVSFFLMGPLIIKLSQNICTSRHSKVIEKICSEKKVSIEEFLYLFGAFSFASSYSEESELDFGDKLRVIGVFLRKGSKNASFESENIEENTMKKIWEEHSFNFKAFFLFSDNWSQKFPEFSKEPLFYIAHSLFTTQDVNNLIKGYSFYSRASVTVRKKNNLINKFIIFQLKHIIAESFEAGIRTNLGKGKGSCLDLEQFLQYEKLQGSLKNSISPVVSDLSRFWRELVKHEVLMKELFKCHSDITKKKTLVHENFKRVQEHVLVNTYPTKNHLIIYAFYLIHLEYKVFEGDRLLSKGFEAKMKHRLSYYESNEAFAKQKQRQTSNFQNKNFFDGSAVIIKTSLAENELNKIKSLTNSCFRLFGVTSKQLINLDYNLLLPRILAKWHDQLVLDCLQKDQLAQNSREAANSFAKQKNDSIIPVVKLTRLSPYLSDGIHFITMLKEDRDQRDFLFILTDDQGNIDTGSFELFNRFQLKQGILNEKVFRFCRSLEVLYKILNFAYKRDFHELLSVLTPSERKILPDSLRNFLINLESNAGEEQAGGDTEGINNIFEYLKAKPIQLNYTFPCERSTTCNSEFLLSRKSKSSQTSGTRSLRTIFRSQYSLLSWDETTLQTNLHDLVHNGQHVMRVIKINKKEFQEKCLQKTKEKALIPAADQISFDDSKVILNKRQEKKENSKLWNTDEEGIEEDTGKKNSFSEISDNRDFCDLLLDINGKSKINKQQLDIEEELSSLNKSSKSKKNMRLFALLYSAIERKERPKVLFFYNIFQFLFIMLLISLFSVAYFNCRDIFAKTSDLIELVKFSEIQVDLMYSIYKRTKMIEYAVDGLGIPKRSLIEPDSDTIAKYLSELPELAQSLGKSQFTLRNYLNEKGEREILELESLIVKINIEHSTDGTGTERMFFRDAVKLFSEKLKAVSSSNYQTIREEDYRSDDLNDINKNILNEPLIISELMRERLFSLLHYYLYIFETSLQRFYFSIWGFIGASVVAQILFSSKYRTAKRDAASLILSVSDREIEEIIRRLETLQNVFSISFEDKIINDSEIAKENKGTELKKEEIHSNKHSPRKFRRKKSPNFRGFFANPSLILLAISCLTLYFYVFAVVSYFSVSADFDKCELLIERITAISRRKGLKSLIEVSTLGMFDFKGLTVKSAPGEQALVSALNEYMTFDKLHELFIRSRADESDNSFEIMNKMDFCQVLAGKECFGKEYMSRGLINMESALVGKVLLVFNRFGNFSKSPEQVALLLNSNENIDCQEAFLRADNIYKEVSQIIENHFYRNIRHCIHDLDITYWISVFGIIFVYVFVLLRQTRFCERILHQIKTVYTLMPPELLLSNKIIMNYFYKNTKDSRLKRIFKAR